MSEFLHFLSRFFIVSSLVIANFMVEVVLLLAAIIGGGYLLSLKASNVNNGTLLFSAFLLFVSIAVSYFLGDIFKRWSDNHINAN